MLYYLNIFQSSYGKVLVGSGCVEHNAASKLIAAHLLTKPSLETGLGGKLTYSTQEKQMLTLQHDLLYYVLNHVNYKKYCTYLLRHTNYA